MKKTILLILAVFVLSGCTQEIDYNKKCDNCITFDNRNIAQSGKERLQYLRDFQGDFQGKDIIFGGVATDTPEMYTIWYNPKTEVLKLNLEKICAPNELNDYSVFEWTGINPCELYD